MKGTPSSLTCDIKNSILSNHMINKRLRIWIQWNYLFIFVYLFIVYFFVILNPASLHAVISVSGVHRSISLWNLWQVFTRFKLTFVIFKVGNGRKHVQSHQSRYFIGLRMESGLNYSWALWPFDVHALKSLLRLDSGTVFLKNSFICQFGHIHYGNI